MLSEVIKEDVAQLLYDIQHGNEILAESVIRKHLTTGADGKLQIVRRKDRATRSRKATQTTGRSRAELKLSARKANITKSRDPVGMKKALKKRKKTNKKRKTWGLS